METKLLDKIIVGTFIGIAIWSVLMAGKIIVDINSIDWTKVF